MYSLALASVVGKIVGSLIGVLGFLVLLLFLVGGIAFMLVIRKHKPIETEGSMFEKLMGEDSKQYYDFVTDNSKIYYKMPFEEVTVTTDDGLKLVGSLFRSPTPTQDTVICMHGYCSTGAADYCAIAPFYLSQGLNVLVPDHRGHNRSEGNYVGFGVLDSRDAKKWLYKAKELFPDGNFFMHGVSMGGATVCQASCLDMPDNVKGIISDCAFTTVREELEVQIKFLFHLPPFPLVDILELYSKAFAKYGFSESSSVEAVRKAKVPMLFIHGDKDVFVPTWMSDKIYDACATEKKYVVVEGAAHANSYFKNAPLYQREVMEFIKKYSNGDSQPAETDKTAEA